MYKIALCLDEFCCKILNISIMSQSDFCRRNKTMAKNPMQKKTRNSFIFGALMMFVIMGLVSAVLAYMLIQL